MSFGPRRMSLGGWRHRLEVTADPAHEEQRLVLRQQRRCADVAQGHRELEAVFGFVNEVAFAIVNETRFLVPDEFGDLHGLCDASLSLAEVVVSRTAIETAGAQTAILEICVLSRTGRDHCDRAFREVPCRREQPGLLFRRRFRMGILSGACW